MSEPLSLIERHVQTRAPLETESNEAQWKLACTGNEEWERESVRLGIEIRKLLSDRDNFATLRDSLTDSSVGGDAARQLRLLYLEHVENQADPALLEKLVTLETKVEAVFSRFRPEVNGRPLTENDIRTTLRDSEDVALRRRTWEASKEIGREVAPIVLEMVELRNRVARDAGFENYQVMSLTLQEIEPSFLFDDVLGRLETLTEIPFGEAMDALFGRLAARFGTTADAIRPWHVADAFFQEAVAPPELTLSRFYENRDLVELARDAFDAMGFEIRAALDRSDLFPRDGKNQHAFCTHIDRLGDDVRVLCNVVPDDNWMDTMMHEYGHAVYDLGLGADLPWTLRRPAHILSTEAIALMFGRLATNPDWMIRRLGAPAGEVDPLRVPLREYARFKQLLFPRWVMVMVHFERELYANPGQDLDLLWWDLVERFQKIPRPDGRHEPDWAAKIHVGLAPVYYQNYLLGDLMASQLDSWLGRELDDGFWFERRETAELLTSRLFADGARHPWNDALRRATGEELDPAYYVDQFVTVSS